LGSGSTPALDHAVLSSGPVFADFVSGCEDTAITPNPTAADYGFLPNSKQQLDKVFGEQSNEGPCSQFSNYTPTGSCNPSPCAGASSVLDASSNIHSGGVFVYDYTKVEMLSAPECTVSSCTVGSVIEGDEAPGALASAVTYWDFVNDLDPPASLFPDRVTIAGQEHNLPSRPAGAKAIRDSLILDCYARP